MKSENAEVLKVLNAAFLERSLRKLIQLDSFADKLAFGIRIGGCWERPFQYEWAFALDKLLEQTGSPLRVVCEQDRVDIGLRSLPPHEDNRLKGGIELKVYGSWWVSKAEVEKFKADVQKVCNCTMPSVAVLACIFASPADSSDGPYTWIAREKQQSVSDPADLEKRLCNFEVEGLTALTTTPLSLIHAHFQRLNLWVGAFFNQSAKALLPPA